MRVQRVLVVHRKSMLQIYVEEHQDTSVRRALRRGDAGTRNLRRSHDENTAALEQVERALSRLGLDVVVRWRGRVRTTQGFDLVVSLGGDGTLLDTSHLVLAPTPLLGINSDPSRSVGALCAGTPADLPRLVGELAAGKLRPRRLTRLRLRVDGQEVLGPVLNDVLFAHVSPAGLSRFDLAVVPQDQALSAHSGWDTGRFTSWRSSGVWISTATGSTGAIRSAGGRVLPPPSSRLQYVVREPYSPPQEPRRRSGRGLVPVGQALVLVNRMRRGMLWADGQHRTHGLSYSQQVAVDRHPEGLLLVPGG